MHAPGAASYPLASYSQAFSFRSFRWAAWSVRRRSVTTDGEDQRGVRGSAARHQRWRQEQGREDVAQRVENLLACRYDFPIRVALLTAQDYLAQLDELPDWWHGDVARRDALFYTRGLDRDHVRQRIEAMELGDEAVHFGEHAVFWAKFDEKQFLKTAYHKRLLREDFYREVTIRSGSTVEKIAAMLSRG